MTDVRARAAKVRLLIVDIDGVMTDGRLYFCETGESMKAFHARDGLGLRLLMEHGIEVGIITGRTSQIVSKRAEDLKIKHVYQGKLKKLDAFFHLLESLKLAPEEVAYVGDDIIDLPILAKVGLAVAVKNADVAILPYCHFVSQFKGGRGAVREVAELILEAQGKKALIMERLFETGVLFQQAGASC